MAKPSVAASNNRKRAPNSRARAARALGAVARGESLDTALPAAVDGLSPRDQGFVRALCFGVLRDRRLLEQLAKRLLSKPLKAKQTDTLQLILAGLYQLRSMRVAPHAAVAETVAACNALGQPRARGLVNAVLRRYQREAEQLESTLSDNPAIQHSHPDWMAERLRADWPDKWQDILAANQQPGPMVLRVNARRLSRDAYLQQLADAGIEASAEPLADQAIRLSQAVDVHALPGFDEGRVSVQDTAAQLAALLLMADRDTADRNTRVLDACAAPGGKTAHLLELNPDIHLTALDVDALRLQRVTDNLQRLGLQGEHIELCCADAAMPDNWWDGKPFTHILLDAPCSGSGVIRRHPDIKWLRRPGDIDALSAQQKQLLASLWPLLAPGGELLYATCSVFKAEGETVIDHFLQTTPDARSDTLGITEPSDWGVASGAGRVILPGAMDGFFYARLRKKPL